MHRIKATPSVPVPDGFTEKVMGRLPEMDHGVWVKVKHFMFNYSWADMKSRWAQKMTVSNRKECSFCFFITAYFYLIMGIVMLVGFKAIGSGMDAMEWIKLQPHLTIGAAIWLLALGVVLMLDGNAGIKAARYGTLIYIFFAVVNGILIRIYLNIPFAGLFIIGFMATSAFMGVMLAQAVNKLGVRTV